MKLRSLALTAVTAGALGISGCGGDDSGSTAGGAGASGGTDANSLLVNTFKPTGDSKIKSATIDLKIGGTLEGTTAGNGDASATIKLNEAKSGEVPEFSADVTVKGEEKGGKKIDLKVGGVYTGDRFYVSYDGDNYDVGEELSKRAVDALKASIKQSSAGAGADQQLAGKLGLHPETWLTDPKVEGTEKVGGVDTYKITGQVNVKTLVPDILAAAKKAQSLAPAATATKVPEVTDAQLDKISKQIKKLDVAIWTGKDDTILRQIKVDASLDGDKTGDKLDGAFSLTLTDVNEEQDIKAPSDTKPITDLMPKLGGLFGAAAGTGALPGAATGSPSSAVSDAYVKCVSDAGGDAAKLNACQAQLQGK
jgi:hypothetical protein